MPACTWIDVRDDEGAAAVADSDFPVCRQRSAGTRRLCLRRRVGNTLAVVDLNAGTVRQTIDLGTSGGASLTGLTIEGNTLYTMDVSRTLRSFSISGDATTPLDSLVLPAGGGKLFAGDGVVYAAAEGAFQGGYVTVDSRIPADLKLLSGVDDVAIAGKAIAINGSGLGVTVGRPGGAFGTSSLDVVGTTDPTDTARFVTRYPLPATPNGVALANGLAFVADGSGGLQIVNYVGFDTKGVAPTVSIAVDGVDVDPTKPGIQVLEGRTVQIKPTVTDDVQVRNVELLVNGKVVANDVVLPVRAVRPGADHRRRRHHASPCRCAPPTPAATVSLSNAVVARRGARHLRAQGHPGQPRRRRARLLRALGRPHLRRAARHRPARRLGRLARPCRRRRQPSAPPTTRRSRCASTRARSASRSRSCPTATCCPATTELRIDPSVIADRAGNALAAAIVRHFTVRPASDIRAASGIAEIGQAPSANPGQQIGLPVPFDPATARATFQVIDAAGNRSTRDVVVSRADPAKGLAYFTVPLDAVTGDLQVFSQVGSTKTDLRRRHLPAADRAQGRRRAGREPGFRRQHRHAADRGTRFRRRQQFGIPVRLDDGGRFRRQHRCRTSSAATTRCWASWPTATRG